jgi:hypothetical protein
MKTFGSAFAPGPTRVAFVSSTPGVLAAAGVGFTADSPCKAAIAAASDRMVGSFFAIGTCLKFKLNRISASELMTFWLVRPEKTLNTRDHPRKRKYMRIIEILSATPDQEINTNDPYTLPMRIRDQDLMQRIANAFTADGAVKRFWNFDTLDQPPDAEPSARTAVSMPDAATSAVPPPSFVPGTFTPLVAPSDGQRHPFPEPRRFPIRR